jgi:hypothetical protein
MIIMMMMMITTLNCGDALLLLLLLLLYRQLYQFHGAVFASQSNSNSARPRIPRVLRNPNVHYRD